MLVSLATLQFTQEGVCECTFVSLHCTTTVWSNHIAVFSHMTANIPVWSGAVKPLQPIEKTTFIKRWLSMTIAEASCKVMIPPLENGSLLNEVYFYELFNLQTTPTCWCCSVCVKLLVHTISCWLVFKHKSSDLPLYWTKCGQQGITSTISTNVSW